MPPRDEEDATMQAGAQLKFRSRREVDPVGNAVVFLPQATRPGLSAQPNVSDQESRQDQPDCEMDPARPRP